MKKTAKPRVKSLIFDPLKVMRQFHAVTNWAELWQEFYLAIDSGGRPKYRTVGLFAKAVGKSKEQVAFLIWYLGPKRSGDDPSQYPYPFCREGPQDWANKRANGGWFHGKICKEVSKEIARRINVLDKMSGVGDEFYLTSVARAEKLEEKIHEAFRGEPFLPDQDYKTNVGRAKEYVALLRQVMELKGTVQKQYALSQGINFDDMEGLVHIMTAATMAAAERAKLQEGPIKTATNAAIEAFVQMTVEKSAKYRLPMPKDLEERIVDTVAETVDSVITGKKGNGKVQ